jgi:facilitated trehalose transporter
VSEISHPEIRGCLSAVLKMAGHLGTLSSFTLGAFLDWRQLATVAAGAPILFFLAILLIPETPSFLLYHGREEEACKSMAWLRSKGEDVTSEMETLRSNIMTKHKSFFPRCTSQFPFRQLFITCGLMFFQKFSGVTVFHHYAVPIFKQVGKLKYFLTFSLYSV